MFENIEFNSEPVSRINTGKSNMNISQFPKNTPIGMAYVPVQQWGKTYDEITAFERGTLFPELDLPFAPEEGCCNERKR